MKIDYTFFDRMLNHDPALPAVPLYEHGVDYPVIRAIMGYADDPDLSTKEGLLTFWKRWIDFYDQMGYPYVSVEMSAFFPQIAMKAGRSEGDEVTRGYVDENEGIIKGWEDLEDPELWTPVEECFPFDLYAEVLAMVPPHMKAVGGCSGGPFENATFLMGLTPFCLNLYEDEELVEALLQKVGERLVYAADRLCGLEKLGVYRFGDDLGFKNATMISPEALRKHIFPWQKKVVETVHRHGKKFVLHSCGQLESVMDDLIDEVGIDAKHSFEDVILPVTEAKRRWGDRIALLGGVDVDFLCRAEPKAIRERTLEILKICAPGGGYAAGTGNTVTSYMPPQNYLAMKAAVDEFNGL